MAHPEEVARRVAAALAACPEVEAVALGGSLASGEADDRSDVDLYVYGAAPPPRAVRAALAAGSPRAELDNRFFEPGDEWLDAASGVHLDVMFRTPAWIEADLDRVLLRHEARVGFSTCFWDNLRSARLLHDRRGWYAALQSRAGAPYPEPLRRAVVQKNRPLLMANTSSFAAQLAKAVARRDVVSAGHRAAAFLASYFDVLFALNRVTHPGEKRLLHHARARCPLRPPGLDDQVRVFLVAAVALSPEAAPRARALAGDLDGLLRTEGLLA
jgi:predicted nucleotidyltransferase